MPSAAHELFRDVIPPVLTPFDKDKQIDEDALAAVVEWFCHRPVKGLFLTGALGEWRHLDWPERERVFRIAIEVVAGRLPVVPHIGGCNDIPNILKLAEAAADAGVYAVALVIPDDIPEGPEPIYEHITTVARATDLPLALYDTYGHGPRSVTADLMRRLLDDGVKIVTMKYRALRGDDMLAMVEAAEGRVNVLAGAEHVFLPSLAVGAVGVIGGGCNVWPSVMVKVQEDFHAGRHDEAIQGQRRINQLLDMTSTVSWPLAGKAIWQAWGLPVEPITRAPCELCSDEAVKALQKTFEPLADLAG